MHIADHTSLKNDGIGVPKVQSVSAIHDILIRGEPSYQSEMFFLVDQETALKLVPLQTFRGPLKWRMMQAASDFLSIVIVVIPTFQKAERSKRKLSVFKINTFR